MCNLGANKMLANLTKLNEKVDQIEIELKSNKTEVKKVDERMDKADMEIKKLRDTVDNMNPVSYTHLTLPTILRV